MNEVKKKKKFKNGIFIKLLGLINLFIFVFLIIYLGMKVYKNYKIYNNDKLLNNKFKVGYYNEENNYIKYSGYLWRILKINQDKSIEIVMDDEYNYLFWNDKYSNYIDSDINKFLNTEFIKELDVDMLSKSIICDDEIVDINKFTCNKINTEYYVKLVNIYDYANGYFKDNSNYIWTSNVSQDKIITINKENIKYAEYSDNYLVKPVVTLKNTTIVLSGDGSIDSPYAIDNNDMINEYYKLGEDTYVSYKKDDKYIYLVSEDIKLLYRYNIDSVNYDIDSQKSLAYYLNNDFYNGLSYKDMLVKFSVNNGVYISKYEDIYKSSKEVYVGIPKITDKISNVDDSYYLVNSDMSNIYYMDNKLKLSKTNYFRNIKVTICIDNNHKMSGNGTKDSPYIVEAKDE